MSLAATFKKIENVKQHLGNFEMALELYENALEIELKSLGSGHTVVATYQDRTKEAWSLGSLHKALEQYQKALKIELKSFGSKHVSCRVNADTKKHGSGEW